MILGSFKLGHLKRSPSKKLESRRYVAWSRTQAASSLNFASEDADLEWTHCRFAVAKSQQYEVYQLIRVHKSNKQYSASALCTMHSMTVISPSVPHQESDSCCRSESGLTETVIEHHAVDRFVINTHAFHNAHFLRATLPRSLVAPIPLYQDRQAKHTEIAGKLRISQESKWAIASLLLPSH